MNELAAIKLSAEKIISHPTWDVVVVFAFIAIGFFYGISAGKWRVAATIMYTYAALAITNSLPLDRWSQEFKIQEPFFVKMATFIGMFLFFSYMLGSRRKLSIAFSTSWWQVFILSFLQVGLLIHLLASFLPPEKIKILSPVVRTVFADPNLHVWWLVVPMAALIILRRFSARED